MRESFLSTFFAHVHVALTRALSEGPLPATRAAALRGQPGPEPPDLPEPSERLRKRIQKRAGAVVASTLEGYD